LTRIGRRRSEPWGTHFVHNGDGVRSSKTVAGDTTHYVVDPAAALPVVISDTEALYLYGLDVIAQQQSERLYYAHDGLGSVRQLVDTTGQIETNYAYDPFGVPLVGGDVSNPYQYAGEAWDAEVELLYLRARYYQPEVGRFITKDPWAGDVWRPGTLNRYVYVTNSPVNLVDPRGLDGDEPLGSLPSDPPPVVRWVREEMVHNAQSDVLARILTLNALSASLQGDASRAAKLGAFVKFGWMVRQGGPWDPKSYIIKHFEGGASQRIGDYWYYYDIWGNIMFGYLGIAGGFSESELLNGAGLEQVGSDTWYAARYLDPCLLPRPRYGPVAALLLWTWDHPEDRVTAKIGMRLWKTHGINVQVHHITSEVVDAGDRRELGRKDVPWFIHTQWYEQEFGDEPWYDRLNKVYPQGGRPLDRFERI